MAVLTRTCARGRWKYLATITTTLVLVASTQPSVSAETAQTVDPDRAVAAIDWADFPASALPTDDASLLSRDILLSSNRYALTTWFQEKYGEQDGEFLDFGGVGEGNIRPPACESLALATAIKTGIYDESKVGVSKSEAVASTVRLVESLAHQHVATTRGGWGDHWQSALWAYYAGSAGWLMWDVLSPEDRERVRRMVEHEADRFVRYDVPYYRDAEGNVMSPGDTKAEENAWNALILQLATSMMPEHPHWDLWMDKNLELMISAYSRPMDLGSDRVINGKKLGTWLNGSNINNDGTLVNHGFIHPDYLTPVSFNVSAVQSYTLAGMATPEAALFNADVVYETLVEREFPSPPYDAPGGTIYVDESTDIYYPQGNDWGTHRRMPFAWLDTQAAAFGLDHLVDEKAPAWEALHAGMVRDMQSRFTDGRTFGEWSEHKYAGREEFLAVQAAQAYMVKWLNHHGAVKFTERAYPITVSHVTFDVDPGSASLEAGEILEGAATVTNDGAIGASSLQVEFLAPPGWSVEPTSPGWSALPPGKAATAEWRLRLPDDVQPGIYTVEAELTYRSADKSLGESSEVQVAVAPPDGSTTVGSVRPSAGQLVWTMANEVGGGGETTEVHFGDSGDRHVVGDWNGDGSDSPGAVRDAGHEWTWLLADGNGGAPTVFNYGCQECDDIPVSGDWDGDGITTVAVVRPGGGRLQWILSAKNERGAPTQRFYFGSQLDTPVAGDWDGLGGANPGVVRVVDDELHWTLQMDDGSLDRFSFGSAGDTPIVGDWDGDGIATVGVVRPRGGAWAWSLTNDNRTAEDEFEFGCHECGDTPVAGDWDGT